MDVAAAERNYRKAKRAAAWGVTLSLSGIAGGIICLLSLTASAATTTPHYAVTESYGWPQRGVTEDGPDCLAAAAVTFLEVYGVHVSQYQFARQDPGANVGHAGVLINGYLRPSHVRVITAGAIGAAQLRLLLEAATGRPVLATVWTQDLPWWHGWVKGTAAHEVMIWRLTVTGVLLWDPAFGWRTAPVGTVAAAAWEYLVP